MRVLIINSHGDDASCGGAERVVVALTDHLRTQGVDVAYLQAFPSRAPVREIERTVLHRTDWREVATRRAKNHLHSVLAPAGARLEEAVRDLRPDLVHTHNLVGIGTGVWEAARRLGLPVVHTAHDYYLLCPRVTLTRRDGTACSPSPFLCGIRTRRLARWSPAVAHLIGPSQHVVDLHRRLFSNAEFHVLRSPVEVPDARPLEPPRAEPSTVGYIGSLDRAKGVHLLLDAAPRLAALGFSLRIAGEGRLRDEVRRAAEQSAAVHWDGQVLGDAKRRFFRECDLGLIPSVWAEPGGPTFTMVEWLAAGRPVIVSERGGLGEVAGTYPGSVAVEPQVDAIVEAVAGLRDDRRWQDLVRAAADHPPGETTSAWAGAQETLYRGLLR
jgi:glycosyltransferase involved in cell wall biosynthesis